MITSDLISGITFWVFKSLWESRNETYKLLSERLKKTIFYASKEYQSNYVTRHGTIKQEEFRPSISLPKVYTSLSLIDQEMPVYSRAKSLITYREIDYLEKLGLTQNGIELSQKCKHIIVKGESGVGKTTFLQKLGIEAFKAAEQSSSIEYIPVFIQLTKCLEKELDLQKMIEQEFKSCGFPEHEGFVDSALKKGKFLILIDELDAISVHVQDSILLKIKDFSELYKSNRIIIACRQSTNTRVLPQFYSVKILGFSSAQAQKYICKVHKAQHKKSLPLPVCQKVWQKISAADNTTKSIVHNPFCLSIVLSLHESSAHKISGKTILYEKILSNLLGTSISPGTLDLAYKGQENSIETRLAIIAEMAYVCLKSGRTYFHKMEINRLYSAILQKKSIQNDPLSFELIREKILNDFIINTEKNLCRFSNPLIHKILVSHHLMGSLKILDESIDSFLDTPEWKDVFIFLAGMQGADYLLSVIQEHVFLNINSPNLLAFMNWIAAISKDVCISSNQAANRCYVTFMTFEIMLLFGDRTQDKSIISNILKQIKEITSLLDPDCPINNLPNANDSGSMNVSLSHFVDPKIMRGLSLERLLDLAAILANKAHAYKLVSSEKFKKLLSTISRLRQQLAGKSISAYHRKICEKNLYNLWINSLEMADFSLKFTASDLQSFYLYCQGSCLIVHCLKEAFYVSGKLQNDVSKAFFTDSMFTTSLTSK